MTPRGLNCATVCSDPALAIMLNHCIEQAGHRSGWRCASVIEATGQLIAEDVVVDILLLDVRVCRHKLVASIKSILRHRPVTILLCVSGGGAQFSDEIFAALANGAMHALEIDAGANTCAQNKVIKVLKNSIKQLSTLAKESVYDRRKVDRSAQKKSALVVIGASTGGPTAIVEVLQKLPYRIDVAVVLIQHLGAVFTDNMVEWMDKQTDWPVHAVYGGKELVAGEAVLISGDHHWVLDSHHKLRTSSESFGVFMPSINAFMFSVSRHWRTPAIGVLLTGMGEDGAEGLAAMQKKGWPTFAQDQQSSAVYSMPRAARRLGAADQVLPPDMIGVGIEMLIKTKSLFK